MIKTSDFHYHLPEQLIAQHPLEKRDASRLLVLRAADGEIKHRFFGDLPKLLRPGDCLVLNNTRVIPARLIGHRADSGSQVEFLLLQKRSKSDWEVLVRPGKRVRPGHRIEFGGGLLSADVLEILPDGNRLVRFLFDGVWDDVLERTGIVPLPPYIHQKLDQPDRYQTVYASCDGSAAAPTAGLHFTPDLLAELGRAGIRTAELTLHVGLGTFRPVKTANILDHQMHAEYYELPEKAVRQIQESRASNGRIVAVGTTACRVLETVTAEHGRLKAQSGWTDIFIYPGFAFKAIDALLTNFHLPESTLVMLVSAMAGRENIMKAYQAAIDHEYRFFSFGDAMLILGERWGSLSESEKTMSDEGDTANGRQQSGQ